MEENSNLYDKVKHANISSEMQKSFLEYSLSVIIDRALPDVRDGLKPVHRRILFGMNEQGMYSDKPYKKCARIVGDVMGKYHPHGDSSIYDAMVRMAQEFSYRYVLVDGHGNFGSIDGDGAAAMRYTESRLSKLSMEMLRDINKDTVDFVPNYDEEEHEPTVLPARFPNLLVNGVTGIAVGMATNIPPHQLGETIDATIAFMDNPDLSVIDLMEKYIHGPDFPTGGYILGRSGIKQAYETGRGSIAIRSKVDVIDIESGKKALIVQEIPYQINKANLVDKIASLVRDKTIDGITALRDESNHEGIRIVIELRRDVQADVVLNQLYRLTALQTSFGVNMMALVGQRPKLLGLRDILRFYIDHQIDVVVRRTQYDLKKAMDRAHILKGLIIALDNIDEVITIIRSSQDDPEAIARMGASFGIDEIQGKAIMDMQLRRLTGLQRAKVEEEHSNLMILIADLQDILANHSRVLTIIKDELLQIKEKYNDERRSEIVDADIDVEDEALIPVEESIIALSVNGYIKRTTLDIFKVQNRGGKGVKGMSMNEDDIVDQFLAMSTHDYLLLFTNLGKVYRIKGYRVPAATRQSKGIPVQNLLSLDKNEKVRTMLKVSKDDDAAKYLFFVTKFGLVKRVDIHEFESIRQNGKIAISMREDDELLGVRITSGDNEIIIGGSNGKAVRFKETEVRPMGRNAAGVRGFNTDGGIVVGIATDSMGAYILSVSEHGYGKRTALSEYRLTSRGVKGVKTIQVTDKVGPLVSLRAVNGDEDALIVTSDGIIIRISLEDVGEKGRNTQGVRLINVANDSIVSAVAIVSKDMESNEEDQSEEQ